LGRADRYDLRDFEAAALYEERQFSQPLSDKRIADIVAGKIEPIAFDYDRAETYLQAAHAEAAQ
jgi:hypothetical protein